MFQSTPPARRATAVYKSVNYGLGVSIHAPRAEGDLFHLGGRRSTLVSIHAPRAEGDVIGSIRQA